MAFMSEEFVLGSSMLGSPVGLVVGFAGLDVESGVGELAGEVVGTLAFIIY